MRKVYWKMSKNGPAIGPTFKYYSENETLIDTFSIKSEIMKIMGVDTLPPEFEMIFLDYNDYIKCRKLEDEISHNNRKYILDILKDINGIENCTDNYIELEVGYPIEVSLSHHSIMIKKTSIKSEHKFYYLDNEEERKAFIQEIEKRIKSKIKRYQKNKDIESHTTHIGSFENDISSIVETAQFNIYIDGNTASGNVHCTGSIKCYRSPMKKVLFDIDKRKIFTRGGQKEIEVENVDQIIDALIRCIADKR